MKFPIRILLVALFSGLAACGGSDSDTSVVVVDPVLEVKAGADQLKLRQFQSCDAYRAFIAEGITNQLLIFQVYDWLLPVPGGIPSPAPAAGVGDQPDNVSTTNLIEAGVDEADLAKTDAEGNLFIASGRYLVIADGFPPASMNTITEFEVAEEGTARRLFVDRASGHAIVVVSNTPDPLIDDLGPVGYVPPGTTLVFIDITDIANPIVMARLWLENSSAERLIDGRVHLLNLDYVYTPEDVYASPAIQTLQASYYEALTNNDEAAAEQLRAEIRSLVASIIAATPIDEFLPRARFAGADEEFSELTIANCANIISPTLAVRLGLTTVLSVNLDGTDIGALTALTTAFEPPYVSADNYYIQQSSDNWWLDTDQAEQTAIHKISIGPGAPEYRAMGLIDGVARNPFQFSEHNGYLRVFTDERRFINGGLWMPVQTNHLFVLEDDGAGTLSVTGSVLDVAPDEAIFAARFLGDRGFLVTFLQIDPLFAFDLSDPSAPTLTGELEIPGFSNYVHPLGDNHLLTIGLSGPDQPVASQVQLQIFDVSDMTQPMLVHSYIPLFEGQETGWSWSPAQYEHKAFTFFEPNGILSFPLNQSGLDPASQFSGFVVMHVDIETGFEELGRIDHDDLAYEAFCQPLVDTGVPPEYCIDPDYRLGPTPTRSVIMTEDDTAYIYSLSNVGVKATPALDANDVLGSILFPEPELYYWIVN